MSDSRAFLGKCGLTHVMDFDQTQAIYDYEEEEEEQVEDDKANPKKKEVRL